MAATKYPYSIPVDFPNQAVDVDRLTAEIQESAIVTALDYINVFGDVCDIWFKAPLSAGDKTILDGLVAAHSGEEYPAPPTVVTTKKTSADGTPQFEEHELGMGRKAFVRTDDNSEVMNIDGVGSGAPVVLWNGTGVDDTGGDWSRTGVGSEAAASKKSGTNGLDTGVTAEDDESIFDNGSMVDIAGTYSELRFWMQVKVYPVGSKLRVRFVDSSDAVVGNQVLVDDYVDNMDVGEWKEVAIPIADFGMTGNAQKLQVRYRKASGQHFWFDDFRLITSSGDGPYRFRIEAPAGERWKLSMAVLLVAAPAAGWSSTSFSNISGGLGRGIIVRQRRKSTNESLWKFVARNNMQLFGYFHPQEDVTFGDDILQWGFMVKPGKATVIITDDDVLEVVVRDDLSSISEMRAFCHYGVEEVS
jgi:hypothetical protein